MKIKKYINDPTPPEVFNRHIIIAGIVGGLLSTMLNYLSSISVSVNLINYLAAFIFGFGLGIAVYGFISSLTYNYKNYKATKK